MAFFKKFEVVYLKANDPITKRALWLREQWMTGGVWRWCVLTGPEWDAPKVWTVTPRHTKLQSGLGKSPCNLVGCHDNFVPNISFDLHWEDAGSALSVLPWWMRGYNSLHWNARLGGVLTVNGVPWDIRHWPAQMGHLWGRRTAPSWAWAHGNCFQEDETAAFEILTSGNRTVLCLRSQKFSYLANGITTWHRTQHELTDTHWNWSFQHRDLMITGQFRLGYAEMTQLVYPTPQGDTRTCHNTKVGTGVIQVARRSKPILQLSTVDALAWEYVQ